MKELQKGMFARSLAGHDKGKLYVILDIREEYVYLADGKTRTLENPKKKKRKHIQPDLETVDFGQGPVRDELIRKALKGKEGKNRCQKQI